VPASHSFDYAVVRVVPCVERGEFVNVAVVLHCPSLAYLGCRLGIDEARLQTLWPELDLDPVRRHVESFENICRGDAEAGPIARLSRRERFHWMVAPRSTVVQVSPVHGGLCESPQQTLDALFERLVRFTPPISTGGG
jgi:hypothetical protein